MTRESLICLKSMLGLLQIDVSVWSQRNFPNARPYQPLLGVSEECGELCHAFLKREQGIRGTEAEHHAAAKDAVGDIIVYLADFCARNGYSLGECVAETWERVSKRDWLTHPKDGGQ